MQSYPFPGPEPDLRQPNLDVIKDALITLRRGGGITDMQADELMRSLATQALSGLCTEPVKLKTLCGLTQSWGVYAARDIKLQPKPFATSSLENYQNGHAAYTLELPVNGKQELYLIDPTFRQFCSSELCDEHLEHPEPGYTLSLQDDGTEILNSLLSNGYIKLTPAIAHKYLSSFCKDGKTPLATLEQSMDFLRNPPENTHNLWFTRQALLERGRPVCIPEEILSL